MSIEREALVGSILLTLDGIAGLSNAQLTAASQQVERDSDGSVWLANVGRPQCPKGVRTSAPPRVRGAYLPRASSSDR